ncbi:MAG: BatA domain-containing protein [Phycisphaeraceae bacterium]
MRVASTLAAVGFVTPLMIGGAVLVTLPILAHLLNRRARRKVIFPSLMLLSTASASQSRLFKLRRWLLLALRCLAVIFVTLAFARPLWFATEARAVNEQGAAAVLVVDVSASAAQRSGGIAAMESLRATAGRTLDGLLGGADRVNVIPADANPRPAFAALTANVEATRQAIEGLEPTTERADLRAAIAEAGRLLAEHAGPRHLVIHSDFQATNWQSLLAAARADPALPAGTRITLVPWETPVPDNLALRRAAVRPWPLVAGKPGHASVEVASFSAQARVATVELQRGDRLIERREIEIQPGQRRELSFELRLDRPGTHRLSFHLTADDALAADNTRYLTATVAERVPVLVIGDDAPGEPGSATYFLLRALAPHGGPRDRYDVRHVTSAAARAGDLRGVAAVLISDVGLMPERLIDALAAHLERGGEAALFCGSGPVDRNLAALADRLPPGPPWRVGERRDLGALGDAVTFAEADWSARLLSPFEMDGRRALQRIRVRQLWTINELPEETRVLLRFDDGTPALAERRLGQGRMVLANFSSARHASDLGKYGSFVALIQRLAEVLRPRRAPARPATAGEALTLDVDQARLEPADVAPRLTGPEGQPLSEGEIALQGQRIIASVPTARRPGFYRMVQGREVLATAAVNIDARESDLRRIDPERVRAALNETGVETTVQGARMTDDVLAVRGQPLWGWLFVAALMMLGLEMALIAWWRR